MSYSDFQNRIKTQFPTEWDIFLASIENTPNTSIRINPRKNIGVVNNTIPWAKHGLQLDNRPNFTLVPDFHTGKFYVQESSSMFIDCVLEQVKKIIPLDTVLDLCAAPGGKSTIILDHLEHHQYLISNEISSQRNAILRENLTKWGYPNFLITENKPADFRFLPNYFDCILIDAPCSGEGLFRKDKNARLEWSTDIADMCSDRQIDILKTIWPSLKEGGILIYSTCTYNPKENELLLEELLNMGYDFESISIQTQPEWNIDIIQTDNVIGYRFLPHLVPGEGFYCSVLKKKGTFKPTAQKNTRDYIHPWIEEHIDTKTLDRYSSYKFKNSLFLAPSRLLDDLAAINKKLYIKQIGIELGNFRGEKIEPSQGLVLLYPEKKNFPFLELTYEQTLNYLSLKDIKLDAPEGYSLVCYQQMPLGFIKFEKSKITNLYPGGWKIRHLQNHF